MENTTTMDITVRENSHNRRLVHGLARHALHRSLRFSAPCRDDLCIADPAHCPLRGCARCTRGECELSDTSRRCPVLDQLHDLYVEELLGNSWIKADPGGPDSFMVEQLACALVIQDYCKALINRNGGLAAALVGDEKTDDPEAGTGEEPRNVAARVFAHYARWGFKVERLCLQLGLTPARRAALGLNILQGESLAAALAESDKRK